VIEEADKLETVISEQFNVPVLIEEADKLETVIRLQFNVPPEI
jgi:hypothetical protein